VTSVSPALTNRHSGIAGGDQLACAAPCLRASYRYHSCVHCACSICMTSAGSQHDAAASSPTRAAGPAAAEAVQQRLTHKLAELSVQRQLQRAAEFGVCRRKQKAARGVVSRRSAPQLVVTPNPGPRARQHARKGALEVRVMQYRPSVAPSACILAARRWRLLVAVLPGRRQGQAPEEGIRRKEGAGRRRQGIPGAWCTPSAFSGSVSLAQPARHCAHAAWLPPSCSPDRSLADLVPHLLRGRCTP